MPYFPKIYNMSGYIPAAQSDQVMASYQVNISFPLIFCMAMLTDIFSIYEVVLPCQYFQKRSRDSPRSGFLQTHPAIQRMAKGSLLIRYFPVIHPLAFFSFFLCYLFCYFFVTFFSHFTSLYLFLLLFILHLQVDLYHF